MVNPEWGIKRICPNCGMKYYDFKKNPPKCPSCKTIFDVEAMVKSRKSKTIHEQDADVKDLHNSVEDIDALGLDINLDEVITGPESGLLEEDASLETSPDIAEIAPEEE